MRGEIYHAESYFLEYISQRKQPVVTMKDTRAAVKSERIRFYYGSYAYEPSVLTFSHSFQALSLALSKVEPFRLVGRTSRVCMLI